MRNMEILSLERTRMKLKGIVLSQEKKNSMIPPLCNIFKKDEFVRTKEQNDGYQVLWGGGNEEIFVKVYTLPIRRLINLGYLINSLPWWLRQ